MASRGPALRDGVTVVEQVLRGEQSFVVKDPVTHKYYRFRPAEAAVIQAFDGTRTVEEIAAELTRSGLAVGAGMIASFARTLSRLGLLEQSLAERTELQMERLRKERRQRRSLFRGEALRMRWSFGDSDGFFDWLTPWCRGFFTRGFVAVSLALFVLYGAVLASHWSEFSADVASTFAPSALGPGSIVILVLAFLGLTLLHEVAHGVACKYFGGEVHELGFMLLYFLPAFFCNVNDAWSFPDRRSRLWVTAAGGWFELAVTSVAALVWQVAVPGTLVADVAVATMLVGGFSALLTNANPLLPLDGYFALADYLELPNLRHRAAAHLTWWLRRHVLRMNLPDPDLGEREKRIFLIYGALAALYLGLFFLWLSWLVLSRAYRGVGVLGGTLVALAILALARQKLVAGWRGIVLAARARAGGARWRRWRRRSLWVTLVLLLAAGLTPWPLQTDGRFTVAPVRVLAVTAPDSGVVADIYPVEGERVSAGDPVVRLIDLSLVRAEIAESRAADSLALLGRLARARAHAAAEAQASAAARSAAATVAAIRDRIGQETIRARVGGTVVTPHPELELGRQVGAGDTLLLIYDLSALEARARLTGAGSARVVPGQAARLMSDQDPVASFEAVVGSVAPSGAAGAVEVRLPLGGDSRLRAGSTGYVRVAFGRSTLLGALWWAVRSRIRNDLLL